MIAVNIQIVGLNNAINRLKGITQKMPEVTRNTELRVARSVQQKAQFIVSSETITHTGLLRSDIKIRPTGKHYKVTTGEHARYAGIIERGRKAIKGRKFIPTQSFPLEGYSVRSSGSFIRAAKGIHFMERATEHGRAKARQIAEEEIKKVIK